MTSYLLSLDDAAHCQAVAYHRCLNWSRSVESNGQPEGELLARNIEGAYGELALARHLGIRWEESLSPDGQHGDVAGHQVRATTHRHGCLILHHHDADHQAHYLVTLPDLPLVHVVGWIRGEDGKAERYWADPTGTGRPAFFVPQDRLHDPVRSPVAAGA